MSQMKMSRFLIGSANGRKPHERRKNLPKNQKAKGWKTKYPMVRGVTEVYFWGKPRLHLLFGSRVILINVTMKVHTFVYSE